MADASLPQEMLQRSVARRVRRGMRLVRNGRRVTALNCAVCCSTSLTKRDDCQFATKQNSRGAVQTPRSSCPASPERDEAHRARSARLRAGTMQPSSPQLCSQTVPRRNSICVAITTFAASEPSTQRVCELSWITRDLSGQALQHLMPRSHARAILRATLRSHAQASLRATLRSHATLVSLRAMLRCRATLANLRAMPRCRARLVTLRALWRCPATLANL